MTKDERAQAVEQLGVLADRVARERRMCSAFETGLCKPTTYCPNCGAKMDGGDENAGSCGL